VQYSNAATPTTPNGGTPTNNVTLVGANPNQPVVISNVAAGVNATDAVNLGQLQTGLAAVNQSTLNQAANYTNQVAAATLASANQYTNQKFNTAMQAAHSAAAVGLAAASLRYDDRPGKLSVAMGGGGWAGAGAGAFGIGYTTEGGRVRLNATGATDGTNFGVGGGLSVTLN
jgi:autotransporter adhesin